MNKNAYILIGVFIWTTIKAIAENGYLISTNIPPIKTFTNGLVYVVYANTNSVDTISSNILSIASDFSVKRLKRSKKHRCLSEYGVVIIFPVEQRSGLISLYFFRKAFFSKWWIYSPIPSDSYPDFFWMRLDKTSMKIISASHEMPLVISDSVDEDIIVETDL